MSDHGWKAVLARISRWLASPVRVEFNPRPGFGVRTLSAAPVPPDEPAPVPRREPIRITGPPAHPAPDRQQARETEYDQLQAEITRLARPDRPPA
jgi:hypothetical protein